jgi:hypothetical protein
VSETAGPATGPAVVVATEIGVAAVVATGVAAATGAVVTVTGGATGANRVVVISEQISGQTFTAH